MVAPTRGYSPLPNEKSCKDDSFNELIPVVVFLVDFLIFQLSGLLCQPSSLYTGCLKIETIIHAGAQTFHLTKLHMHGFYNFWTTDRKTSVQLENTCGTERVHCDSHLRPSAHRLCL